ncbi:ribokinase [Clostridium bovifaecis]|uniref:Ribokinase n=1 Tax=Clostridium bovifaecis TaxID=2184719 RepID=A0A6I6EQF8_9CLOT|nr:ribokinase [Clostridium bovifaecis]
MGQGKIVVMGSFVVDLMGRTPHLPVKGETVKGSTFMMGPGGKGSNQGVAAKRAGANVVMVTKVGNDDFANIALRSFKNEGMDTRFVFMDEKYSTGAALIMVDENTSENEILVTLGACNNITDEDIEKVREEIESSGVLLTQLETNVEAVEKVVDIAYSKGVKIILNPAPVQEIPDEVIKKVHILTPNEVEASILSGVKVNEVEDAKKAAKVLMEKGAENVIITLGSKGSLVVTPEKTEFIESIKVNAIDTTGAGDAYNGGLATALAEGKDIFEAAKFANIVGALSVTKIGTAPAMPYRKEIDEYLK